MERKREKSSDLGLKKKTSKHKQRNNTKSPTTKSLNKKKELKQIRSL